MSGTSVDRLLRVEPGPVEPAIHGPLHPLHPLPQRYGHRREAWRPDLGFTGMTERKPREISFTLWIDQQIAEATERGAFDNLPGAGKPLPDRGEDAGQAWLRDYLRREGVAAEDLLPEPLRLRKEIERLADTVPGLRSEQDVRDVVAGINRRIIQWRRIPEGPPIFLPLVNEETMVSRWRDGQPVTSPSSSLASGGGEIKPVRPRRWYRLRRAAR